MMLISVGAVLLVWAAFIWLYTTLMGFRSAHVDARRRVRAKNGDITRRQIDDYWITMSRRPCPR